MGPSKNEIKDSQRTRRTWVEIINKDVSHFRMLFLSGALSGLGGMEKQMCRLIQEVGNATMSVRVL